MDSTLSLPLMFYYYHRNIYIIFLKELFSFPLKTDSRELADLVHGLASARRIASWRKNGVICHSEGGVIASYGALRPGFKRVLWDASRRGVPPWPGMVEGGFRKTRIHTRVFFLSFFSFFALTWSWSSSVQWSCISGNPTSLNDQHDRDA